MALPKISTPTFECELPSTKESIRYRPFLVKEEKVLLIAKESGEKVDIYNAIKTIVNNCVLKEGFDVNECPTWDMEYLFIQIRSVSVGNIVKFKVTDSDDGIEYDLELDLNEVEIQKNEDYSNKIELDENIGLIMKYPSPSVSEKIKDMTDVTEITYELIKSCIDAVWDENDVYPWDQESAVEQDMFLEMLPVEHYKKVSAFFQNMPKIEHVVEYENSNGKKKKAVFRNLNDFFMLG